MGKTIKQLAEELNVSKTAIRKRLTPDFKAQYVETGNNGSLYISDDGCKLISESFRKVTGNHCAPPQTKAEKFAETVEKFAETTEKLPETSEKFAETTASQSLQAVLDAHRETVATLREQIDRLTAEKQQLNEELSKELAHSRELADRLAEIAARAQGLHAGTLLTDQQRQAEQAETVTGEDAQAVDSAEDAKEHGFLWRLLHGKHRKG